MGTTGENPTVSDEETKDIISAVIQHTREASGNSVPVIVGKTSTTKR